MALTPLSPVQLATVVTLAQAGRLEHVQADLTRAANFLRRAGGTADATRAEKVARELQKAAFGRGVEA